MRRFSVLLCSAIQNVPEGLTVSKDYQRIQAHKKELMEAERKREEFKNYPLRYQILECRPGLPLALTKLKYLVACRRTHPEAGGNAEEFLRVSLAYQDVMKDYGVETVDNQVVNLGNFQSDDHEAQNYLSARAQIESYIPISTLEDHIKMIEEVKSRLGDHLSEKLASHSDEAMWLLEDIEDMMEQTGLKTVKLQVLEGGKVHVTDTAQLTDGTEKPLYLPEAVAEAADDAAAKERAAAVASESANESSGPAEEAEAKTSQGQPSQPSTASTQTARPREVSAAASTGNARTTADGESQRAAHSHSEKRQMESEEGDAGEDAASSSKPLYEAMVSAKDIEVLNAKNNLQDRNDVAGLASRTATEVMNNTQEVKEIKLTAGVLFTIFAACLVTMYASYETVVRAKRQAEARPQAAEHMTSDTLLPWWGNDAEYESQVKRIFIEEWRRARASSRRTQTFQDGVARESLDDDEKKKLDLQIFTVTAERLRAMRENAERNPSRK